MYGCIALLELTERTRVGRPGMSEGTKPPTPPGGRVFVGRERELHALRAALADAFEGRGRLVMLVGDPGIGKTRMAEELASYARSQQAQVLVGRCYDGEGASAYWPWVQAIRSYVRKREPAQLRQELGPGAPDIAQIIREVHERLPNLPQLPFLEAAQARFRLFDGITTFLTNAGNHQPIVLILDDLHWADTPSLLLLQFLAREIREAHLLLVGCYREEEIAGQHPRADILGELARHEHCQRIFLRGLTEEDVTRYIELTAGERPLQSLAARVHRETEGNPLFVGEIVRLLVTDGRLASLDEASSPLLLPPGVRETIGRRLERLSDDCNRILAIASVIGQEFGLTVLEQVSELSRDQLIKALAEAADARVVTEMPHLLGRYRLAHPLIREALYTNLHMTDRMRLHRQIGEALEHLYHDNVETVLTELAHHFFQAAPAGDVEKAVDYAVRAAERSLALLGYEEAVAHYERALQALDLADPTDQSRRCKLLLALGDAQGKSGEAQKARQTFQLAAEIARKLGDPEQLARAAVGTGQVWVEFGAPEEGLICLLEEALGEMGEADSTLRARLLARLGAAILYSECHRAAALTQQAVEIARRVGDSGTLAYAVTARQFTGGPDDIESRLATASELVSVANVPHSETALVGRFWRIHALLELGDRSAADLEVQAFTRGAEKLRQPRYLYFAALFRTTQALLEGRFDEAEGLAQEALALGQRWSPRVAIAAFGAQIFMLRTHQGRLQELEEVSRDLALQYQSVPGFRFALAYLYGECGREEEARTEFERAAGNDFADLPRNLQWLTNLATLSGVCTFLDDRSRAATLYGLLLPYAARNVVVGAGGPVNGPVSHWLGMLARTMSRWNEAVRHFEDALALHVRMQARAHLPYTQHALAVALAARGDSGDRDKALGLLAQAFETTEKLGMTSLRKKVVAVEREIAHLTPHGSRTWTDSHGSQGTGGRSTHPPSRPPTEDSVQAGVFRREGDYWTIAYEGTVFRLKDSVGLRYVAELLGHPGGEFLATDLVATLHGDWSHLSTSSYPPMNERLSEASSPHLRPETGVAALDPQAKMAYKRRMQELREELDEARAFNDVERASRVQGEVDFLGRELARGVGLGGRDRKSASQVERARLSVTRAIRAALRNIARNSAPLGSYLDTTIKTGTFCSYTPDPLPLINWRR